jgi:DNA repair protein RadA/Sms
LEELAVPDKICFAAEVGLGGELRAVNRVEQRISEAEKLGFSRIYISKYNKKSIDLTKVGIQVSAPGKLNDVFQELVG